MRYLSYCARTSYPVKAPSAPFASTKRKARCRVILCMSAHWLGTSPPYKGELREERQRLFYGLYLLAQHAPVHFMSIRLEKTPRMNLETALADLLFEKLEAKRGFFSKFDEIVLHYDYGQPFLIGIILGAFRSKSLNARYEKTLQSAHPFMQVADLLGEMELVRHHCEMDLLTKSEISFFGEKRKIKKDYLKPLDRKTI